MLTDPEVNFPTVHSVLTVYVWRLPDIGRGDVANLIPEIESVGCSRQLGSQ